MRAVTRLNPIYLLIALNVVLILFRDFLLPEEATAAIAAATQSTLLGLGVFGYIGLVVVYGVCGFFFIPLLIPLNILGGALYGAWVGTAVALTGITVGSIASTTSVRHVFTGMQGSIDKRPGIRRLLAHADSHPNLAIALVRFAVVVPYLFQNIALGATQLSQARLTIVTAFAALPGAAIYSFLGAGLVHADRANELVIYVGLPMLILMLIPAGMAWFAKKSGDQA